jgi:hypothetical protein
MMSERYDFPLYSHCGGPGPDRVFLMASAILAGSDIPVVQAIQLSQLIVNLFEEIAALRDRKPKGHRDPLIAVRIKIVRKPH